MSDGYCYIAMRGVGMRLEVLEASLHSFGLVLANPWNGAITVFGEDGSQLRVSREWVRDNVARASTINLQFWFSSSSDLLISIRSAAKKFIVLDCGLDGKDQMEREKVCAWAEKQFLQPDLDGPAALLIIDLLGITEPLGWDDFLKYGQDVSGSLPDAVGLDLSVFEPLHLERQGRRILERKNQVISCKATYKMRADYPTQ
jgi:hypothetical protein